MPVYFIRQGVTGPVKIGVAADIVKRVRQLQTNQPVPLRIIRVVEGDPVVERELHRRFHSLRVSGEWFNFDPAMMSKDLALADLPIPLARKYKQHVFPENAWGREHLLHRELLLVIGGADALAKRLRLPPWEVVPGIISQRYWSASVLLAIEAGRSDITLDMLFEARALVEAEQKKINEHNAKIAADNCAGHILRRELEFIKQYGLSAVWWNLSDKMKVELVEQAGTSQVPA